MTFDWTTFFRSHHIEFDVRGKNVSAGHVAIACPFCGGDDPSRHLAVSLDGNGWHCWRKGKHSGRSPVRLVAALLHCSIEQARALVGPKFVSMPDSLLDMVKARIAPEEVVPVPVEWPDEFRRFQGRYSSQKFELYLKRRGFSSIEQLGEDYDLAYAITGRFHGRVLFMVRSVDGDLVGWTGRTLYASESRRYLTHEVRGRLLWEDRLPRRGSDTIVLCEGPMDGMKVNVLGESIGVDATVCFTSSPNKAQIARLYDLLPRYKHRYVLLDRGTISNTMGTVSALEPLGVRSLWIPDGLDDPGELQSTRELARILEQDDNGTASRVRAK